MSPVETMGYLEKGGEIPASAQPPPPCGEKSPHHLVTPPRPPHDPPPAKKNQIWTKNPTHGEKERGVVLTRGGGGVPDHHIVSVPYLPEGQMNMKHGHMKHFVHQLS